MPEALSIIFSSVALLISLISAVWGVATHKLTGQYPKIEVGAVQIFTPGSKTLLEVLQITVANYGRVSLTVASWTITFPPNASFVSVQADFLKGFERVVCSSQPEVTVAAGGRAVFYYPLHYIVEEVDKHGFDLAKAYVQVNFAAHKPLTSRRILEKVVRGDVKKAKHVVGSGDSENAT